MYPNPQDVLPLPPRSNLEQYETQAKELVSACLSGAPDALREWAARWPEHAPQLEAFARDTLTSRHCALTGAQFVIARMHGFESWPKFSAHLDGLARAGSPISNFEAAAEAVVAGDVAGLERLMRQQPSLVRARSARGHRATLLHYAAANGVENYRQKTPANAVAIVERPLSAGAEVDAEADMYGGGCTTLGLVATSIHPERAGVQNALMQTLIDHGAVLDHPGAAGNTHLLIKGCLANGRLSAARFLASRGARLDLEGAAGIGRLDVVQSSFDDDGTRKPIVTMEEMRAAFGTACTYGQHAVAELLLDRGVPPDVTLGDHGQMGLHWAALGGHADIVGLLLDRRAPVNAVEERYHGTPLTWALHGWSDPPYGTPTERYYDVIALLVRAGAEVNAAWLDDSAASTPFTRKLRADPRMMTALSGGTS
jgi:ankyrin repeat protein